MNKRVLAVFAAAAVAVSMLVAMGTAGAQTTSASPTINATPDDTWMTNGVVYSVVRSGNYVYVGGKFTRVRSAATGGQKSFAATNLARFDAESGVADPTWTPDVTGEDMTKTRVYALAEAGGKIWVGGKFGAVDGVARRNLAAVSPDTGAVDPNVDAAVGSEASMVRAMVASATKVYIGGAFGKVDDKGRKNLAAFDPSGELQNAWRAKTDKVVWSLAFSCDGQTLFAGGKFHDAAGSDGVFAPRKFIARFDSATGSLHPWAIPAALFQSQDEVASDLAVTCERITSGFLGPNFLRSFRLDDGNTGSLAWGYKTGGDVQAAAMLGADKVIVGGHFSQVDGKKRTRIAMVDLANGSPDPSWTPVIQGKDGGAAIGPWDLLVDEDHLYVGGGFYEVGGKVQTHLARFTFSP